MPTISLSNNTNLNFTASSADNNATLNRYLKSVLTFRTPPSFDPIANLLVKDQSELDFPITLSAAAEGTFAIKNTTLRIQAGASASIGFVESDSESGFLSSLEIQRDPSSSGLVSFGLHGTLTAENSATASDFTFGIGQNTSATVTSYYAAAAGETLGAAVQKAAAALTIPHDIEDLKSLPAGAICQLDATSALKFTASVNYNFLNDPLAAASLGALPPLGIHATASATLECTVTHTSGHTLIIAKLSNEILHASVSLAKTDDFETSLTVSSGIAANIGNQDALTFLLNRINPNSAAEADAIAQQMKDARQFKSDIKSAIDAALTTSFGASLQAALEKSKERNRAFLYRIDLNALDENGQAALQAALTGDFTAITKPGAQFKGIEPIDSALTVTASDTHTLALHFLGIFNASSIHQFIAKSKVDVTSDTHEIVLSDETLQVVDQNLNAEKLRKLVLKAITLTLPASANTKDVEDPVTLTFLDREANTSPSKMRQFLNVLNAVSAASAGPAQTLFARNLKHYGICSLSMGLSLNPAQCRQLFIGASTGPYTWQFYIKGFCNAEKIILAADPESAFRLRLFNADQGIWNDLQTAGDAPNMIPILRTLGLADVEAKLAVADAITAIWWSEAMAAYAAALTNGQSLEAVGNRLVQNSNRGFSEPWMILAAWAFAGEPPINPQFTSSLATG